jgi:hypothetical protein
VSAFLVFAAQGKARAQKFRGANGGFGTAINAILPGASHAKIFQKYGLEVGIDYYLTKHGEGMLTLPDRKGLEFVIADTAKTNAKAKGQTPESLRVLDGSVLDEIRKNGFLEKVKG